MKEILDRMVDHYSPRIYMAPQRSDIRSALMEAAREARRVLPHTRFEIIPETDHLLMLENPEEFNRIALRFLQEVDGTRESRKKKWQNED